MMKFLTTAIVAGAVVLGGCATLKDDTGAACAKDDYVCLVVAGTKLACDFVPTAATIANIVSSGASIPISTVVTGICTAVKSKSVRVDGARPMFRGVPIEGHFER